jgi:DNA-binding response OmpR family regulator
MNTFLEIACDKAVVAPVQDETRPSYRILVVEDDRATRQLSIRLLVGSGYQVDAAEDGASGWKAIQAKKYDLLITDNSMPKLSGVELVKKVRSAHMTLPVILASGALPTEELDRNPWLQLAATLVKPFSSDALLEKVTAVLGAADSSGGRSSHVNIRVR